MAAGNPLYDLHAAIWSMMEDTSCATDLVAAGKHFTNLVAAAKRKKMTATVWDFLRDSKLSADFPECVIVQTGLRANDRGMGCNGTGLDVLIEMWIATGEQPADRLWDVQWAAFRQWMNWEAHLSYDSSLTWSGDTFVWNADLLDSEDTLLLTKLNKTVKGWSCAWRARVQCFFVPSDLTGSG